MVFIYRWRKVSDAGVRKFGPQQFGKVVDKVFQVETPSYELSEEEWKSFIIKKMRIAKQKGIIDNISAHYDVRITKFSTPIWKGWVDEKYGFG
jgi:hypothetical protein